MNPRAIFLLLLALSPAYADSPPHWAFPEAADQVEPPAVRNAAWAARRWMRSSWRSSKRRGSSRHPRWTRPPLLRRVTFDLTGLPPTLDELDRFLADEIKPNAFEKVVDRLPAPSPHYGERQAQHWLDVARYAESDGYEVNADRPHAWRYRDYVVRSFNHDKPYDRFLIEQLAGDELAQGREAKEAAELWIATGFNRCGPVHIVSGNVDKDMVRQEVLTEMANGVGAAILGLTSRLRPLPRSQIRPDPRRRIITVCRRSSPPRSHARPRPRHEG